MANQGQDQLIKTQAFLSTSHNHWNMYGEIKVLYRIVDKIAKYIKINCRDVDIEKHKTVLKDKKKISVCVEGKTMFPAVEDSLL